MVSCRLAVVGLCGLAMLSTGEGLGAQQPSGRVTEEIEVTEVLLDVLVTDKKGRVILGLAADDFVVTEDGEPVEITGVTFYSSHELLESPQSLEELGVRVDEVAEERYFILFVQQQRRAAAEVPGLLSRQRQALRDVEEWLTRDLRPRDLMAVAIFETRLAVIQDFTNNLDDLRQAVDAAMLGHTSSDLWPSRRPAADDEPSLLQHLPAGKELSKATPDTYRALQVLAGAAGSVGSRVNLLFFGRGVGEIGSSGFWEPDSRYFEPTVRALNDNNVAVYPLSLMPGGSRHSLEQSLNALAWETGGVFHRQFTSFLTPLEKIAEENGGYYLLSYQSRKPSGASGFQEVEVELRNPELRVRGRRGYLYGEPDVEP